LGADCNFRVLKDVKPNNLNEIASVVSLARPGALHFVKDYSDYINKNILPEFDFESEKLREILKETGGVILFQETLMRIAKDVFELTLEDAEDIRRCVGKKKHEEMQKYESIIKEKGEKLNIPKSASFYWKTLIASASYSFNRSHAISYSFLAAQSIYLKFKYPLDFFLESLKLAKNKQDISKEIGIIQSELKYFSIRLLPPDLVRSDIDFKKDGKDLRFGLSAIKGIADKSLEKLKEFINSEKTNKFEVFNAAKKAKLNVGILSALIQAGTLDSIESNRPRMVYESQIWSLLTEREKVWCIENGEQHDYSLFNILALSGNILNDKGARVFKDSRLETLKKRAEQYRNIFLINSKSPDLADYCFERRLLGFSYSQKLSKLMNRYSNNELVSLLNAKFQEENAKVSVAGEVGEIEEKVSKNKKKYIKINLYDESDMVELLLFEHKMQRIIDKNAIPKEGDIIIADVSKWNDTLTVDDIKINTDKVYLKLAELRHSSEV
jgi:DNA polymerase-3 subunit alpha